MLMFTMYARVIRRFGRIFISSSFSCEDSYLSIVPSYQRFLQITFNHNLTRSLYVSPYREANIVITSDNEMELNVDYNQLLKAQKDDNILIVDVREQNEINETGKLPGSIHIPMGDVENIFLNLSEENFEQRYGRRKPTKDSKIIFSCRSGRRSAMVQEAIQKLGYAKVYNYTGGWLDWESKQSN
ncbi:rhodanese domain-containing protein CG4456-like isoform X1 [Linepithema humile]|uniref:rhodanese domain-containing protein CG4456-like isoform X1 n=2 Tax=Linepithema humile TaxID=83485 RepID=UPI0006232125|nr:PREDICTED: heat shock protein 67B2-like [Linepithema humile]